MKKKELRNLAKRIAVLENKLQKAETKEEKRACQNEIIALANKIPPDLDTLSQLDILIQEFLEKF